MEREREATPTCSPAHTHRAPHITLLSLPRSRNNTPKPSRTRTRAHTAAHSIRLTLSVAMAGVVLGVVPIAYAFRESTEEYLAIAWPLKGGCNTSDYVAEDDDCE